MSVLSDSAIHEAISRGDVVVRPMAPGAVGSNSVDLHLGPHLATYVGVLRTDRQPHVLRGEIDTERGTLLSPGMIYLAATVEWVSCGPYAPMLEGTSGAGRLGLSVHVTAGVGDVGFAGHWTLEITVVQPLVVFGGEPVAQLVLHDVRGEVTVPYDRKPGACYVDAAGSYHAHPSGDVADPRPQPSRMFRKPRWLGRYA